VLLPRLSLVINSNLVELCPKYTNYVNMFLEEDVNILPPTNRC
jgi:hypothetical protein